MKDERVTPGKIFDLLLYTSEAMPEIYRELEMRDSDLYEYYNLVNNYRASRLSQSKSLGAVSENENTISDIFSKGVDIVKELLKLNTSKKLYEAQAERIKNGQKPIDPDLFATQVKINLSKEVEKELVKSSQEGQNLMKLLGLSAGGYVIYKIIESTTRKK